MNRKRKILAICLSVYLSISSVPPQEVHASWFSDLCGSLFTFITAPIWVFCPDNPTFRKNNPFRKKVWEENMNFEFQPEKPKDDLPYHTKRFYYLTPEQTQQYKNQIHDIEEEIHGEHRRVVHLAREVSTSCAEKVKDIFQRERDRFRRIFVVEPRLCKSYSIDEKLLEVDIVREYIQTDRFLKFIKETKKYFPKVRIPLMEVIEGYITVKAARKKLKSKLSDIIYYDDKRTILDKFDTEQNKYKQACEFAKNLPSFMDELYKDIDSLKDAQKTRQEKKINELVVEHMNNNPDKFRGKDGETPIIDYDRIIDLLKDLSSNTKFLDELADRLRPFLFRRSPTPRRR